MKTTTVATKTTTATTTVTTTAITRKIDNDKIVYIDNIKLNRNKIKGILKLKNKPMTML